MNRTLSYIVAGRLTSRRLSNRIQPDTEYIAILNNGNPQQLLHTTLTLRFTAGHAFRIVSTGGRGSSEFTCETIQYWYQFETSAGHDVISFHWTPEAGPEARRFPHIHVGPAVCGAGEIVPDRFHKLHIPSGRISIASVVRFAIQELGVIPLGRRSIGSVLDALVDIEMTAQP